ncbi:hypothetical protein LEMA_P114580.1 [Plenodomus lingam JN3]|uniref:Uncharacterized protein n=1 Tax=Leptosphaeria maculans (strain JN3 / isolate v23.1.3 / race Av1-4-5-6-7-8) TaxID=985895 RepID=E4ZUG4_LEPMJ|nr:hypothetical protein LEMA_P114580.1 [Plenodomus lingam JN3]CBX95043.1 hypothetical protein LEMA_P114580.1 [Plenodomus lingam JN3]
MAASISNATYFDFHCQGSGGKWWACPEGSASKFVGCCVDDPCSKGCAQGDLRSVGYNTSHYGEWPDASCGQASNFFSCIAGDSFWGCCKSNSCASPSATCPQNDLTPAFMDQTYQFNTYARTGSSAPSPSASSVSSKKSNTGAIVGGVVGGVLGLSLIAVLIYFLMRKKKRNQVASGGDLSPATMAALQKEKGPGTPYTPLSGQSPPPTYSAPHDRYQSVSLPSKNTYAHYANHDNGPQELPADAPLSQEHRFSELPATQSDSVGRHHISELPVETSDIQSSHTGTSPRQLQTEFSNDLAKHTNENVGLGVSIDEGSRKHRAG